MSDKTADEAWRGKMGKMSPSEIDQFLGEPFLARVACLDGNGWPHVVPCWYQWDGKAIWVVPRAKSMWAHYLAAEPRCAVTIDESSAADEEAGVGVQRRFPPSARRPSSSSPTSADAGSRSLATMSIRYYGEKGPSYLEPTMTWNRWLVRLDPVKIQTWQGISWPKSYLEGDAVVRESG